MPTSSNVLSVIKYEFIHKNRISSNIHDDANGAKIMFDHLLINEPLNNDCGKNKIVGYIHELGQNPFGYLLISDIQVLIKLFF